MEKHPTTTKVTPILKLERFIETIKCSEYNKSIKIAWVGKSIPTDRREIVRNDKLALNRSSVNVVNSKVTSLAITLEKLTTRNKEAIGGTLKYLIE